MHRTKAPPIVRMAHALAFARYLRSVGSPVGKYFRLQGLPTLCENPNDFVSLKRTWAFFDVASSEVDPLLGWYVGRFVGNHNLNAVLRRKLEHAPTLYRALERFVQLARSEASQIVMGIEERPDDVLLYTEYPGRKEMAGYSVSQAYKLGVFIDLIRHFVGKSWAPEEIGIEDLVAPPLVEEFYPGTRILPRQRKAYISVQRSLLHWPSQRAEAGDSIDRAPTRAYRFDYVETLRTLLRPYLAEGYLDTSRAASLMDTSVRSLERRLTEVGLSYRTVIDELRFTEARKLLMDNKVPIIEVSAAVGFDDPSHFTRMFRRIGGITPRAFRRSLSMA